MSKTYFPGLLGELARAGHPEAAAVLAREWGGTARSIPNKAEGSRLAELIGLPAAHVLASLYGGEHVDIPAASHLSSKKLAIASSALGTRETAKVTGCSERHVRRVRRELGIKINAGDQARPARKSAHA